MSFEKLQKEIGQLKNNPINSMTDEQIDELTKKDEERQYREEILSLLKQINEKLQVSRGKKFKILHNSGGFFINYLIN